jgi:nucleoside 2-deoxyribosyltransferase
MGKSQPEESAQSDRRAHTPLRVYVAASAAPESKLRVDWAVASLKRAGFVVTCTWPEVVASVGESNPRDASHVDRRSWAIQDLDEVDDADVLWFLVPSPGATAGAWYEAGYAYDAGKHLVFSGDTKQSVFCSLGHEFGTDEEALGFIKSLERRAA